MGAILILFRRSWPRLAKTGAIVLCLVAYLSVSTFGMAAARSIRESQLNGRQLAGSGTGHPFWHTAYIGLGYLPNDWDIRYYDAIAYRDVLREDPKAMFLGPAYGGILRDRYFTLVGRDPLFYVEEQGAKVLVASAAAGIALLALALAVPWLMFVDAGRPRWRRDGGFIRMAGAISPASPLLAPPASSYLLGWLGVVLFAAILAAAAIVADWSSPTGVGRVLLSPRALVRAPRGVVASTAVASVLVLVVAGAVGPSIKSTAQRWHDEIQTPHVEQPPDATH